MSVLLNKHLFLDEIYFFLSSTHERRANETRDDIWKQLTNLKIWEWLYIYAVCAENYVMYLVTYEYSCVVYGGT